jgi:hypothetical protein
MPFKKKKPGKPGKNKKNNPKKKGVKVYRKKVKKVSNKKVTKRRTPKNKIYKEPLKKGVKPMAKSKKRKKRRKNPGNPGNPTRRRRRAQGGAITDLMTKGGLAVVGAIGAGFVSQQIPIKDPRVKALVPMATAFILSATRFGRMSQMKPVMLGFMVASGMAIVRQFMPNLPLLAGEGEQGYLPDYYDEQALLGYNNNDDLMDYDYEEDDLDMMGQDVSPGEIEAAIEEEEAMMGQDNSEPEPVGDLTDWQV